MSKNKKHILVIKQGALGDIINATGALSLIRRVHAKDHVVCLTAPLYESFMKEMPYFDEIWIDPRTKGVKGFMEIISKLRSSQFDRVYDLQGSERTGWYKRLMKPFKTLEWIGFSPSQTRRDYHALHTSERFSEQLQLASFPQMGLQRLNPDLSWLKVNISHFLCPQKMVLLVPGSSKKGQYKRWPSSSYGELAQWLIHQGYHPVFLGGPDEEELIKTILTHCPQAQTFVGQTNFFEIAGLARKALALVGNDTGPTHIGAAVKCRTLFLWSNASDPRIYAPRGSHVHILYEDNLRNLSVDRVIKKFEAFLSSI